MARTKHTLPAGTYRVIMSAYCGMSWDVATGLDRRSAVRAIVQLARRRRKTGHDVTHRIGAGGLPEYEFQEPAGCALIPDTAGTAWIEEECTPAWECFECGDVLPVGTGCTCQDPIEPDDVDEDEDEEERHGRQSDGRYVAGYRVDRRGNYREDFGSDR